MAILKVLKAANDAKIMQSSTHDGHHEALQTWHKDMMQLGRIAQPTCCLLRNQQWLEEINEQRATNRIR